MMADHLADARNKCADVEQMHRTDVKMMLTKLSH